MFLTAIRDGKKPPAPAPLAYQIFTWRHKMKIGYFEAMTTPYQVIINDLEMMALEDKYGHKHEQPTNKKGLNNGSIGR